MKEKIEAYKLENMMLTLKDVAELLSVHRTTLWRYIRDGRVPKPIEHFMGPRWRASDLNAFFESLSPRDPSSSLEVKKPAIVARRKPRIVRQTAN